jgi:hypothetical protein
MLTGDITFETCGDVIIMRASRPMFLVDLKSNNSLLNSWLYNTKKLQRDGHCSCGTLNLFSKRSWHLS